MNVARTIAGVPVLVVLPLTVSGAGSDSALVAAGLHDDICGALTRFRSLRVISPRSAAAVAELGDREIGEMLGASHLLRGRLQSDGATLRLSASLVACADSTLIWNERIDVPEDRVFQLQDDVIGRIASTLNARIEEAALGHARRLPVKSLAAHQLTLRGLNMLRDGTIEADEAARELFEQALALEPLHARAHAGISLSWFNEWSCQFWDRFEEASRRAYVHAHRALEIDDRDAMVHLVIAKVQLHRREFEQASWYLDRALALCPNDADLLIQASLCEVYLGRPDAGVRHVDRAMRLDPFHPNSYFSVASFVSFFARDLDAATAMTLKSDSIPFVDAPAYAAAAFAHAGRLEEARRELDRFHAEYKAKIAFGAAVEPGSPVKWVLEVNPFRRAEDVEYLMEGLRLAGETTALAPTAPDDARPASAMLAPAGGGWVAEFDGQRAVLPDLKGLADISRLLGRPDEEIHCLDLAERAETTYGADAALDDRARAALKARIRDLQEDLADAEDMNDTGRAERARAELDALLDALSKALGLGGRARRLGDLAERARTTVTWRIRHAIRKVEAVHEPLGRHFANSIRTGAFCVYRPEHAVRWQFHSAEVGSGRTAPTA